MLFLVGFVLVPFPLGSLGGSIGGKMIVWLSLLFTLAISVYAIWIPLFRNMYPGIALMIPFVLFTAGSAFGSALHRTRISLPPNSTDRPPTSLNES